MKPARSVKGLLPNDFALDPTVVWEMIANRALVLWRDGPSGREGLLLSMFACDNPECTCDEVALRGSRIDETVKGVAFGKKSITLAWKPSRGRDPADVPERPAVDLTLDLASGEVRAERGNRVPEAEAWVAGVALAEFLDTVHGRALSVRGINASLSAKSLPPATRGLLRPFLEAYPNSRVDRIRDDRRTWQVLDSYCPKKGCACDRFALELIDMDDADSAASLLLSITTRGGPATACQIEEVVVAGGVSEATIRAVANRWLVLQGSVARLRERQNLVATVVERLMPPATPPGAGRAGRNDACPCGSGRKYKKCCLGRQLKFDMRSGP